MAICLICCLAHSIPASAKIENRIGLSQVGRNSVIILYRNPRPHACGHQKRHKKKRGEQDHSRFVTDKSSLGAMGRLVS